MPQWILNLLNPNERLILRAKLSVVNVLCDGKMTGLIDCASTHVLLTTQRILVVSGLLNRSIDDRPLREVLSVKMDRSMSARLLGFGTLTLYFGKFGLTPLTLRGVKDPEQLRSAICYAAECARQR